MWYSALTQVVHQLLAVPLWVFLGLVALLVVAFRRHAGALHRWRRWLLAGTLLYYVVSMPIVPATLERWIEGMYPVPAPTAADRRDDNVVLVLTAGWLRETAEGYEQKIGEAGYERVVAAVDLWQRIGGRILFTGAPTPDGRDSAAAAMARLAARMGVPTDRILVEPAATNTHENIVYSLRMLGDKPGRIWLLTSAFHVPRSVAVARAAGITVVPYPVDFRADERPEWTDWLPGNMARPAMERSVHELLGLLSYRLKGWS